MYRAPRLQQLCSVQQHHKTINSLRWHPDHIGPPELSGLLASGSSNAIVFVHDLRAAIGTTSPSAALRGQRSAVNAPLTVRFLLPAEKPSEEPVVLNESYRRLCGHTAKITAVAWSPHHAGRLVTTSYDGTAQVGAARGPNNKHGCVGTAVRL